jgi:hypothetical protein
MIKSVALILLPEIPIIWLSLLDTKSRIHFKTIIRGFETNFTTLNISLHETRSVLSNQNFIPRFEGLFGKDFKPIKKPMSEGYHPEVHDFHPYTPKMTLINIDQ